VDRDEPNAHLDRVLVGGRERRTLILAEYDPAWPGRFAQEREKIARALGETARAIEHIGSTAVPGLAAKPIIDVMVVVADPDDENAFRAPLERAGYELRVREPRHRMFRTPERDVHIHLWAEGSDDVARQLAFRDRLRASASDREAYARLKADLIGRAWEDMNHYAEAKGPFIESVLRRC
jgi:GrpB-like predicted nucleotidyltransferase (UPF0157 family)